MIESAMLVAFGFCAATLLALIVLPFVTRRAARLAAERLRDVVPLTVDEIVAERDGLRAMAAVEQRRLEQKVGHAEAALATREADLGRRTSELAALHETREGELAAKATLAADLARVETQVADGERQREALQRQITEADRTIRTLEQESRSLAASRDALEALAEERRAAVAGLDTRCAGLEMRRDDLEAGLALNRSEQEKLRAALTDMTRDRDLSRTEVQLLVTQRAILQDDLGAANRRAETHRLRMDAKADALARAEQLLMTEKADHLAVQTALEELRRRFQLLEARLIAHGGAAGPASASETDALRAEVVGIAGQVLDVLKPRPAPSRDRMPDPGSSGSPRPADPATS